MSATGDVSVRTTGGQVDELVMALLDGAFDQDGSVKESIRKALHTLGNKQPALVLSSSLAYLHKHAKLSQGHRIVVLQGMEAVLQDKAGEIEKDLAKDITKTAIHELTAVKEVVVEWQTAASGVLVALGKHHCHIVMEQLLEKFPPGVLPHFFVLQTMANLAVANVFDMVPFLKSLLGQMLPILGMARLDNMKWVLAQALSKFSEAILEYVANIEKAPDSDVTKEAFSMEIDPAFDILFQQWLSARESKLRLAVVEALGNMSQIMSKERLEENLIKLIPAILNLYKKHTDTFQVTQGLGMILQSAIVAESATLALQLENILNCLFQQVCIPVDFNNPQTVKSHGELLRCFNALVSTYCEKILQFLLNKMEPSQEKPRLGALAVLRHLINSSGAYLDEKHDLILTGMKIVLGDQSNKVKKALAQAIIAMAHHGYLELEGGQMMIEFIVMQCTGQQGKERSKSASSSDPDHVSTAALQLMCENALQMLANTVDNMDGVLWPYLLEYLVPEQYTDAIPVLCKSICSVAKRLKENESEDFVVDFDKFGQRLGFWTILNLPRPCSIISRLLVLSGVPNAGKGKDRGALALSTLLALAPTLQEDALDELWQAVIPRLLTFLKEQEEKDDDEWEQKTWEDLLLKMVTKTIDQVGDEEWTEQLANALGDQVSLYNNLPQEKNFLYKALGAVLKKSGKKEVVERHLTTMFESVKYSVELEREGCAVAVGFVASAHLDSVLAKLDTVYKLDTSKKSSGLFGFIKDMGKADADEFTKSTVMLCYGYGTLFAPTSLITSRMEAIIARSIVPQFISVKEVSVRQSLIVTANLIGQAMHPEHLGTKHTFTNRPDFLLHMQRYLQAESTSSLTDETRKLALTSCATLIKLDPTLSSGEQRDMVKIALDSVLPLPPGGVAIKKKEENFQSVLDQETLLQETLDALQDVLHQIILKSTSSNTLNIVLEALYPFSIAEADVVRERALELWLSVLRLYQDKVQVNTGHELGFGGLGVCLAHLVPRCTDPVPAVRVSAVLAVHSALRVAMLYAGRSAGTPDPAVDSLRDTLREKAQLPEPDPSTMLSFCSDLSKVIAKKLPSDEVRDCIRALYAGLLDPRDTSASGTCVVLNGIVRVRGGELVQCPDAILRDLHALLPQIEAAQTKQGTLRAVRTLTTHHMLTVLTSLITYQLPLEESTVEIWHIMSADKTLANSILDYILDQMARCLPYTTQGDNDDAVYTATLQPVMCTCILEEILKVDEAEESVKTVYPRILASLMLRIASSINNKPPRQVPPPPHDPMAKKDHFTGKAEEVKDSKKATTSSSSAPVSREVKISPNGVAVSALKQLLYRIKNEPLIEALAAAEVWDLFTTEYQYPEAFTILARCMIEHEPKSVGPLIEVLMPSFSSVYDPQRVMLVAFFAELIKGKCAGDLTNVETLTSNLLQKMVDPCHKVRRYCIRGLANVAYNGHEVVQKFSTTVLSAMMAGMDDKDDLVDDITLEAMDGLTRILQNVAETDVRGILINIALRIRPCFEKDRVAVRAAAFSLFGQLAKFGDGPSKEPFLEQVHTNLVSILLHLNDPESEVRKACKHSLREIGPLMGSEPLNSMFQRHLLEDAQLHYGEFMNDLAKIIVADFSGKLNFYVMGNVQFFRSQWPEIRANAVLFAGFLLGNMSGESYTGISQEHVCGSMVNLLKDTNTNVRIKAAEAMSLLHNF